MKAKKLDNFKAWRDKMKIAGKIINNYPELQKNSELAELTGVILGDGHICKFPRTQGLLIFSNANNLGFAKRYADLVKKIFNKEPRVYKVKNANMLRICIYQNYIAERLNLPWGNRSKYQFNIPEWIELNKENCIALLRGLFEAEGSLSIHKPTSTYNFQFSNYNNYLLIAVRSLLEKLGFHPEVGEKYVRLRRKAEVHLFKQLINFRVY